MILVTRCGGLISGVGAGGGWDGMEWKEWFICACQGRCGIQLGLHVRSNKCSGAFLMGRSSEMYNGSSRPRYIPDSTLHTSHSTHYTSSPLLPIPIPNYLLTVLPTPSPPPSLSLPPVTTPTLPYPSHLSPFPSHPIPSQSKHPALRTHPHPHPTYTPPFPSLLIAPSSPVSIT